LIVASGSAVHRDDNPDRRRDDRIMNPAIFFSVALP